MGALGSLELYWAMVMDTSASVCADPAACRLDQCLAAATARLEDSGLCFGHGTACAADEAWWLVSHVLDLDPRLEPPLERRLSEGERARVEALLEQRVSTRRPLAYLLGHAWFAGHRFRVDESVLVPRSPLAELIEERFEPWVEPRHIQRVLELGTGSGCIAVACAMALPWARVDATDICPRALALARTNAAGHGVAERVRLVESDLYQQVQGEVYDLIVTNPPYVPMTQRASLPAEYRAEPGIGLFSGADGLDHAAQILAGALAHLSAAGVLVLEVGPGSDELQRQLPEVPFTWLEFRRGGEGVLLAEAGLLREHRGTIAAWLQERRRG